MIHITSQTGEELDVAIEMCKDTATIWITQDVGKRTDEIEIYEGAIVELIEAIAQEAGLKVKIEGK